MTADEQAFWDAIAANPGDDLPRRMYVDYLMEKGAGRFAALEMAYPMPIWSAQLTQRYCAMSGGLGGGGGIGGYNWCNGCERILDKSEDKS